MRTVILIDDDIRALADIRETFHFDRYGFEIAGEYRSAEEAIAAAEASAPDLIVSDICMSAKHILLLPENQSFMLMR